MKKLWGGRFSETSVPWIDAFGASISVDQKLAKYDIAGSIAHTKMLMETKILPIKEGEQILNGLKQLQQQLENDELTFTIEKEDIHLNIEHLLSQKIGPVAGKLHTARSRNDQVATDMHLYLKSVIPEINQQIQHLRHTLVKKAELELFTIVPGYTHLQHAQPISFGHQLMAYYQMFTRDQNRFENTLSEADISPLGSAALGGTTFSIDRELVAKELGFSKIYENSLDAVSNRDYLIEFLSNASLLMMHLSRLCEEIILWCSHEFQFVELSDSFSTGSSIMPQKKNPDMAELIRGKTGRIYGNLFGLLTTMKGLPLAYNKDLQEDKEPVFDSAETILSCLPIMAGMIDTMVVKKENMQAATEQDFSNATELADYLASKGLPFRKAHEIVGKLVLECIQQGIYLQDLPLETYQKIHPAIQNDIFEKLTSYYAVANRNSAGGTGFEQVKKQIEHAKRKLTNPHN